MTELDLRELTALKFVELFNCKNLVTVKLGTHPVLERLCVEECNLDSLDLSGCTDLEDLRCTSNDFTLINWGSVGQSIWHICTRDNPKMIKNVPALTQFPLLEQLLTWNANQKGTFVCHSSVIKSIDSHDNHYTSADISGCNNLTDFSLSGSQLASLNLGTANNLTNVSLEECGLTESQIDYVLHTLDRAGRSNGFLDLTGNASPSAEGLVNLGSLKRRGWTIIFTLVPVTSIAINVTGESTIITTDNGTLQLSVVALPANSTYKIVTWSILNGTGQATINASGLVTAIDNGTVTARATARDTTGIYGDLVITISNQVLNETDFTDPIGKIIVTSYELEILLNDNFVAWKACLYNLHGNLVSVKLVESDALKFDISLLSSGIYIVVLSKGNNIRVAEVIRP